jgi:predicted O-methyltransferase YrrM
VGADHFNKMYQLGVDFSKNSCHPPGDPYSVIISVDEVKKREQQIWGPKNETSINLNTAKQLKLVEEFKQFYPEIPWNIEKKESLRYYFDNNWYSYSDGVILYSIIRYYKPKRIIEVGSGFSSALMLDMKEKFFNHMDLTFIEPEPERLYSLLHGNDRDQNKFIISAIQDVDLSLFNSLEENDMLFIDSSHVSKTGSDINTILFDILPGLKKGVLIHFHDIFYPFEYPQEWVYKGQNWNEDYILKAFLMYNKDFEIMMFSDYLHIHHSNVFSQMPLCYKDHGGNLWIQKM